MRIAKRHHNKHALAFMATTVDATLAKNADVSSIQYSIEKWRSILRFK